MGFGFLDGIIFFGFIAAVLSIGILKSRHEKTGEDYFLAGRGLSWWLIGFSLIAANISTEQFIGMSGSAAKWLGLAIASYEWMAAITLVVAAFTFLPRFLKSGIYTIPEFLEYKYNSMARSLMAGYTVIIYVFVTFAVVVYSGALTVVTLFPDNPLITVTSASWAIGMLAAIYVASGGLKAVAWADLLQGSALILGGGVVLYFAMKALGAATPETVPALADVQATGAWGRFTELNAHKLHMVMPRTDPEIPWTALVVGLWIPNFYYWGLNQYITQRTLGAKSLAEGQKGVVFAAALKLIIPFIIVFPGIIAFNLYSGDMSELANDTNAEAVALFEQVKGDAANATVAFNFDDAFVEVHPEQAAEMLAFNAQVVGANAAADVPIHEANAAVLAAIPEGSTITVQQQLIGYKYDSAFALLIKKLVPPGLRGFMLAAILGAVMSSLASMLNSASTIFTMDLYRKYMNPEASQMNLVTTGRICVAVFAIIGCFVAPYLDDPRFGGVFKFIQEFQGYISPGILAVFVFGMLVKKAPPIAGVGGLILNPIMYGLLAMAFPSLAFLDRMAISFFCVLALMGVLTVALYNRTEPKAMPVNEAMELEYSRSAQIGGVIVVIATLCLYAYFW